LCKKVSDPVNPKPGIKKKKKKNTVPVNDKNLFIPQQDLALISNIRLTFIHIKLHFCIRLYKYNIFIKFTFGCMADVLIILYLSGKKLQTLDIEPKYAWRQVNCQL